MAWLSLQQNHLQFTGYSDDMGNIRFLFRKVEEGKFNAYSDTEYLTKETSKKYKRTLFYQTHLTIVNNHPLWDINITSTIYGRSTCSLSSVG